ncbi:hypothetical protein SBADM41S_05567 [Streptomyces badius]
MQTLAEGLRLPTNGLDYAILAIYFVVVLGIGFMARASVRTSLDFFLSGRSLPAWVTGLAFVAANLGATEILGMAATGAQYGVAVVHWYWIGAIPAMVFLGLVMMPFYYRSKVRSVPEFLLDMGAGGARGDVHPGRDQPGALALGDPHQHFGLARGEHPQQPPPSSSGWAAGLSSSAKAPRSSCGATALSARALSMARSTPSMRSSCRTYPTAPAANTAAIPRGLGTGAEDDHRHLRALLADARDRVEDAGGGGRGRTEQADLRGPADDQFRGARGRRGGREHPVPAEFQCRGECLGEQTVIVDHHEPHAHRSSAPKSPVRPAPRTPDPARYTLARRRAALTWQEDPRKMPDSAPFRPSLTCGR